MHASAEPPKQRSYPAYCDVSPAIGPGSTKIVPYAQHSVTSYINGQLHMERSMNSVPNYTVPGATNKPYLLPKPPVPPIKTESGVAVNSVGNTVPNKVVVGQNSKPAVNNKSSQNVKHVMSKSIHPQFIDPPEEFQFLSSKRSRLALLLISGSIQSPLTAIYIVIVSNVLRGASPTYPYLFSFSSFQIHWHPPHPFYFLFFFVFTGKHAEHYQWIFKGKWHGGHGKKWNAASNSVLSFTLYPHHKKTTQLKLSSLTMIEVEMRLSVVICVLAIRLYCKPRDKRSGFSLSAWITWWNCSHDWLVGSYGWHVIWLLWPPLFSSKTCRTF